MNERSGGPHPGCLVAMIVGLVLFGGIGLLFIRGGNGGGSVFFLIVAALLAAGLIWMLLSAQQASLIDVAFEVNPIDVRLGDTLRVRTTLSAKRRVPLTNGKIELRCQERAISRGGTQDTTYTHLAYTDEHPIDAGMVLEEGMSWVADAEFQVPDGLAPSYSGRNNFIEWSVHFRLGLRGPLLDITRSQALAVRNERV